MGSSTGGEDKSDAPPRPDCFTAEQWDLIVNVKEQISGRACVPVWCQSASIFPAGVRGRVLIFAEEYENGLHPWQQAIVDEVVKRLAPEQDNALPHAEWSLSAREDSPAIKEQKRENRLLGLRWSSSIRRFARAGIARKPAVEALASAYQRTAFAISILVKHANEARWKRIDAMRRTLIPIWESQGAGIADVARRLNVTSQYARRLRADIHWQLDLQKETST